MSSSNMAEKKRRRAVVLQREAKKATKIENAVASVGIRPDEAVALMAGANADDFVPWLEVVGELTSSPLALQERRKKTIQLHLAYQALITFNGFAKSDRQAALSAMLEKLEHRDRGAGPGMRAGRVKKSDPVTAILKSLALYRTDDPTHRATLSKDRALLIFAVKQRVPVESFPTSVSQLRTAMTVGQAGARARSTLVRNPVAAVASSDVDTPDSPAPAKVPQSIGADPALRIRGLKKLNTAGVHLVLVEIQTDGSVRFRTPARVFGDPNALQGIKKAEIRQMLQDATLVVSGAKTRKA